MSSSIWTQCAGPSNLTTYSAEVWRVVEGQGVTSTRKLVDSPEEHDLLERLLDGQKPLTPTGCEGRHYLLSTPFRYPPLKYGSRFGARTERSLWYGAEEAVTGLGETAFYRFWFLRDSAAREELAPIESEFTAFRVRVLSQRGIDLTRPPFVSAMERISSPVAFEDSQQLGREMRADQVTAFRWFSARHRPGICVGVFSCDAFVGEPFGEQQWHCYADLGQVEFRSTILRDTCIFPLSQFLVDGHLAPRPS